MHPANAGRVVEALREFGFSVPELNEQLFLTPGKITRMGFALVRIEISTTISGVEFDDCRQRAMMAKIDGVPVPVISLSDLRTNKKACARGKDLVDLDHLPEV